MVLILILWFVACTTFKDTSGNGLQLLTVNSSGGNIHFNGQLIETGANSAFSNKELDTLLSANGDVAFYDGMIAEFIVFKRQLSENEIHQAHAYLSNKWF